MTILEIADRAMGRAISPAMSSFFADAHRAFGADLKLMTGVAAIRGADGRATEVETTTGEILPADAVIVGVGIVAEDALALQSGLACDNGIVVDETMTTSDPSIYAIGDCASFPSRLLDRRVRLESVQNATDQAKCAAKAILGKASPYDALPWFWSDQGDLKLQIAGLSHFVDAWVTRGDPASRAFAVFGFLEGSLRGRRDGQQGRGAHGGAPAHSGAREHHAGTGGRPFLRPAQARDEPEAGVTRRAVNRHCECSEAIHLAVMRALSGKPSSLQHGLLRCARNDGLRFDRF